MWKAGILPSVNARVELSRKKKNLLSLKEIKLIYFK
jgi:hypothetical protein